ncbi:MAG: DMT family transporter [Rhizobiaceae bacterium]|nr:MAG: DMT family transporter [Rhizobiaceae bacterium]CAG1005075.1 putative amino-acid metabolite efflux pump [Rhizobiaceae bacterium]
MTAALNFERRDAVDTVAVALMVLLTFSWGLNSVAAKITNTGFNPIFATCFRSALGAVLVFGWCRWRRISLFDSDGTLWPGVLAGALFGFEFALIFFGLDFTSVARSVLLVNTMPFWVLVGAHFLLGERMTVTKLAGLVLAFLGVAVVFYDKLSLIGPQALWGDLMSLGAGALWGATTLVIKSSRLVRASAEKILLYQLVVSALVVIPLVPLAGPVLRGVSAAASGALLFQAIYIVAFTYVLWFWLMRRYPAAGLSSFAFLTPVFGVFLGGVLLDEPLSAWLFVALAMIAAGLAIVNRPQRRQEM